jgi:acyl-CoA reductase-like NAD-dependent aldehyde dehydrogenase
VVTHPRQSHQQATTGCTATRPQADRQPAHPERVQQTAVAWSIRAIFTNTGQVCLAGSRIYVERGLMPEFLERFRAAAEAMVVGDPKDVATQIGPMASEEHYGKVRGYVETIAESGGRQLTGTLEAGWTITPTIIVEPDAASRHQREEIFGPVVTVTPFDTEAEVVGAGQRQPVRTERDAVHREPDPRPPSVRSPGRRHSVGQLLLRS